MRREEDTRSSCTQSEEALAGEACVASLQGDQELLQQLSELDALRLSCQPEENDQLDLIMETDGLRKSIHNLGTIVTTRWDAAPLLSRKTFEVLSNSWLCLHQRRGQPERSDGRRS